MLTKQKGYKVYSFLLYFFNYLPSCIAITGISYLLQYYFAAHLFFIATTYSLQYLGRKIYSHITLVTIILYIIFVWLVLILHWFFSYIFIIFLLYTLYSIVLLASTALLVQHFSKFIYSSSANLQLTLYIKLSSS